jgi:hypothetical protein
MKSTNPSLCTTPKKLGYQELTRSTSQRLCYANDELSAASRGDMATIFHSPYRNGKRNSSYINPTFTSSNLFYGEAENRKDVPKHNLVLNRNERSKRELYSKRIQKEDHMVHTVHQENIPRK